MNQTITKQLVKYINEQETDWDEHLEEFLFSYQTSVHASTRCTQFYLMFGRGAILYICHYPLPWGQSNDKTVHRKEDERPSEILLTIGRTHTRHTSPLDTVWPCQIVEVVLHCHTQPECLMLQCSACQELYHEQCEVS